MAGKIEGINKKIDLLQREVAALINHAQTTPKTAPPTPTLPAEQPKQPAPTTPAIVHAQVPMGPHLSLRCKNWEDFQNLASQARMLSFSFKEAERVFEVNAVKGNQVISFSGELPKLSVLLKCWLSMQLTVSEKAVLDGVLSLA
ncbi:MAG: hypothetical protein NWF01_03020 [Candidatus Bathyarchaeota archaeon]|nr:hypothetical protein [Candidatus Bathyarchaeota archaeon]